MLPFWKCFSLHSGAPGFRKQEAGRTMVCVATEILALSRYSCFDGIYPLLLHFVSSNHEANVSYHFIQKAHFRINLVDNIVKNWHSNADWNAHDILEIIGNVTSLLVEVFLCHVTHKIVKGIKDGLAVAAQAFTIPSVIQKLEEVRRGLLIHWCTWN